MAGKKFSFHHTGDYVNAFVLLGVRHYLLFCVLLHGQSLFSCISMALSYGRSPWYPETGLSTRRRPESKITNSTLNNA